MGNSVAVAAWGLLLRESKHRGEASHGLVRKLAQEGLGADKGGYRKEFLELVERSQGLSRTARPR